MVLWHSVTQCDTVWIFLFFLHRFSCGPADLLQFSFMFGNLVECCSSLSLLYTAAYIFLFLGLSTYLKPRPCHVPDYISPTFLSLWLTFQNQSVLFVPFCFFFLSHNIFLLMFGQRNKIYAGYFNQLTYVD